MASVERGERELSATAPALRGRASAWQGAGFGGEPAFGDGAAPGESGVRASGRVGSVLFGFRADEFSPCVADGTGTFARGFPVGGRLLFGEDAPPRFFESR